MPIDFRKLVEQMNEKNGYCSLRTEHYASIPGLIYSRGNKGMIPASFHYIIQWQRGTEGWKAIIKFLDGPTGWEGYYIDDILMHEPSQSFFCICAGGGDWPEAQIETAHFLDAIARFKDWMPGPPETLDFG